MGKKIRALRIPFLLLFVFWALVILIELSSWQNPDIAIARWTNSFIGRSPTYDLILTFLILSPGDILGAAIMFLLILRLCVHNDRMNRGRIVAFGLLILINMGIAYELIDYVQDHVPFPSPASIISPFKNLNDIYGSDIDLIEKYTYPSMRASLYFLVAFICFARFGPSAMKLCLPSLVFSLPRMMAGAEGFTGVVGGFLVAWLLTAINTLIFQDYLIIERRFGAWYKRAISPRIARVLVWVFNRNSRNEKTESFATVENHKELPSIPLDNGLQRFVEDAWGFREIRMIRPPRKGRLFQLFTEDETYAFKISRYGENQRGRLDKILKFFQTVSSEGLFRTPDIIPALNGSTLQHYQKRLCYVMEWVGGRPLNSAAPEETNELIRRLAMTHLRGEAELPQYDEKPDVFIRNAIQGIRNRASSALKALKASSFSESQAGLPQTDGLGELNEDTARAETIARMAFLYAQEDSISPRICYTHGDPHPMNYLVQPDGNLVLLDFDRSNPGLGYMDLAPVLRKLTHRYQWDFEMFESTLGEYLRIRSLPRFEIVLLLAEILYPRRTFKRINKSMQKSGGISPIRVMRDRILSNFQFSARRKFVENAAERYRIPLINLTYYGPMPETLLMGEEARDNETRQDIGTAQATLPDNKR